MHLAHNAHEKKNKKIQRKKLTEESCGYSFPPLVFFYINNYFFIVLKNSEQIYFKQLWLNKPHSSFNQINKSNFEERVSYERKIDNE